MAGGPTTPALVLAAAAGRARRASWPAATRTAEALRGRLATRCGPAPARYGVNLFAPNAEPVDPAAYARLPRAAAPAGRALRGRPARATPVEDDDGWQDKVDVLVEAAPPVVSFTFGLPDPAAASALRRAGCAARPDRHLRRRGAGRRTKPAWTRWSSSRPTPAGTGARSRPARPPERLRPPDAGPRRAGGRRTSRSWRPGESGTGADVRAALEAGAEAVAVGTLLLLRPEAGTNPAHRAGLDRTAETQLTTTRVQRSAGGRAAQRVPRDVRRAWPRSATRPCTT